MSLELDKHWQLVSFVAGGSYFNTYRAIARRSGEHCSAIVPGATYAVKVSRSAYSQVDVATVERMHQVSQRLRGCTGVSQILSVLPATPCPDVLLALLRGECPSTTSDGNKEVYTERLVVVEDFIEGTDLFDYLYNMNSRPAGDNKCRRERYRTIPQTLQTSLCLQMASTLAEIHRRGVVHRDIKIENVRVTRNLERVYLIDFGLALITDPRHLQGTGSSDSVARADSDDEPSIGAHVGGALDEMDVNDTLNAVCSESSKELALAKHVKLYRQNHDTTINAANNTIAATTTTTTTSSNSSITTNTRRRLRRSLSGGASDGALRNIRNLAGTTMTMSPDLACAWIQHQSVSIRDYQASDVWACGLVMLSMVSGWCHVDREIAYRCSKERLPSEKLLAIIGKLQQKQVQSSLQKIMNSGQVEPQVRGLISMALNVDPALRPSARTLLSVNAELSDRKRARSAENRIVRFFPANATTLLQRLRAT